MQAVNTVFELRSTLKKWRLNGERIAFIPTMGNLHQGHLQLLAEARNIADRVLVSIFVNPTQFTAGEDFDRYPRTEVEDRKKLDEAGADLLFLPSVSEVYDANARTMIIVTELSEVLCGKFRPGHFSGVATVVCKLFNMAQPDFALFGLKDYQQWLIIQTMARDLNMTVELIPVEIVREASGLALSSRNGYLNAEEKSIAPKIYQTLCAAKDAVLAGCDFAEIERNGCTTLQDAGFVMDYFSICRRIDLKKAADEDKDLVILAAAKLGKTRLIDNIRFYR